MLITRRNEEPPAAVASTAPRILEVRVFCETSETYLWRRKRAFTSFHELTATCFKPIEPESKPRTTDCEDKCGGGMLLEERGVCSNQKGSRNNEEVKHLHSLSAVERKPTPGMFACLLGYLIGIGWRCHCPAGACRPASVIRNRTTLKVRPPATTRSFCAVASSARTSATIVLSEKPCARMTASVQPSGEEASRASARWLWEGRVRGTTAR